MILLSFLNILWVKFTFIMHSIFPRCLKSHEWIRSRINLTFFSCKFIFLSWFCSSFNDKPINEGFVGPLGQELFEKEQNDLLADLVDIPRKACDSRVWFYFHIIVGPRPPGCTNE